MSVMGLFFIFIASVVVMWLWRQGVMDSNWLEEGEVVRYGAPPLGAPSATKVGLAVFLAVAGCLFSLMTAAFFMRMAEPDWQASSAPAMLWVNTAVIIVSDAALLAAQHFTARDDIARTRLALAVCAVATTLFLLGQLWIWRGFVAQGLYASSNPSYAFFYLLTGAHGLHLIGGLVGLARTTSAALRAETGKALAASVDLCAIYWHFLTFVWLLLFAMLTGGADGLGAICRRILS